MCVCVWCRKCERNVASVQFVLSQCVFDGSQRFSFVLQFLLQLPERAVPLLSIQQDLLKPQKKNIYETKSDDFEIKIFISQMLNTDPK